MQILTGKALSRRTFLKGMGATVALPALDAMVPAVGSAKKAAAAAPTRFIAVEVVHGAAGCNAVGASRHLWAPEGTGRDFSFGADNALKPIEQYRDYLTIISNTDVRMADPIGNAGEIGGDHFRSSAVFLTQAHPKQTNGSDLYVGTSLDQVIAKRIGGDTPIPSMQLCIENLDQAGGCTYNYSCAYTDTISWSNPSTPLPMLRDPRIAFDMLFGAGSTNADRAARRLQNASILDWILGETAELKRQVGPTDRLRIDQYLENVRELERRIQKTEARNKSGDPRDIPEASAGVPDSFSEHMKMMYDFQVLALQADMTRVFSFKTGRDASNRSYPESGFNGAFHGTSHYGAGGTQLDKMKNTPDGDSNLLENSLILYGSPMGDSNLHNHRRCPLLLLGHAGGKLQGNLHLKATDQTPMANAFVSVANMMGLDDMKYFGDSTGKLSINL
jgi:hypothetical protein